jgi:hypothetical protein
MDRRAPFFFVSAVRKIAKARSLRDLSYERLEVSVTSPGFHADGPHLPRASAA